VLGGRAEASACGLGFGKSSVTTIDVRLRVLSGGAWTEYRIDRMD
jgi:hypothetical protein